MIPILESYKTGLHDFPSRDTNPKLKGAGYALKNAEAIYSLYCQNQCAWGESTASKFYTNRAYSTGRQNVEQYKNFLLNEYNQTENAESISVESWDDLTNTARGKRMGWMNISWQNLSPAPAIMNSLHGQFDLLDFDLYVDTIDADSRGLIEEEKYKEITDKIDNHLKDMQKLEDNNCDNIDEVAECYAEIIKDICLYKINEIDEETKCIVGKIAYNVGKWVYSADAFDDIEKDIKKNMFNPYLARFQYEKGKDILKFKNDIKERSSFILCAPLKAATDLYEDLDDEYKDFIIIMQKMRHISDAFLRISFK